MDVKKNDTTRGANFTTKASIGLNTSLVTDTNTKKSVLAHEIGHYIGLHEGYVEDQFTTGSGVECNNNRYTVMDASGCEDLQGPSSSDKSYIENAIGGLQATGNLYQSYWYGDAYVIQWKDQSFGELYYIVDYYKVTSTGLQYLYTVNVSKNTGLRQGLAWTSDRIIEDKSFSKTNRASGTYRAVITPYFKSYDRIGKQVYTDFSF